MRIDLFLFTTDPGVAAASLAAGIDGFVVDWECEGKRDRQEGFGTEVNAYDVRDLEALRTVPAPRLCRINAFGSNTQREVDAAVGAGATHVLLPMVRRPSEVDHFLRYVDRRAAVGILMETRSACAAAKEIALRPLDLVFVGLNDLAIERGSRTLFEPLVDGLAMELRNVFGGCRFGLGGLTTIDKGDPVPCLELMAELARHACDFTFLRRSFKRDIVGRDMKREVELIGDAWDRLRRRSAEEVSYDHQRFVRRVRELAAATL